MPKEEQSRPPRPEEINYWLMDYLNMVHGVEHILEDYIEIVYGHGLPIEEYDFEPLRIELRRIENFKFFDPNRDTINELEKEGYQVEYFGKPTSERLSPEDVLLDMTMVKNLISKTRQLNDDYYNYVYEDGRDPYNARYSYDLHKIRRFISKLETLKFFDDLEPQDEGIFEIAI